ITVPGPFTMTKLAQNDYYESDAELATDYAVAVNDEIRDLFAAGADLVQIDEPYMQVHPADARAYGIAALQRALDGVAGTTVVHGEGRLPRSHEDHEEFWKATGFSS